MKKNYLGELIKAQHEKSNFGISDLSLCLCCETGTADDEPTCIDAANNFSGINALDAPTINHADMLGMTPLKWACANHLTREVQQLIEIGADVNAAPAGTSALSVAIDVIDIDIVKLLIDAGADVNAFYCEYEEQCAIWSGGVVVRQNECESLLTRAIDVGDIDIVKLLIDGGADVDGTGYEYSTPLMTAIARQSIDTVEMLIEAGADVNRLGLEGDTALMAAALCDDVAAIKALLSAGADVAMQTGWGELTAIDILESETIGVPPGSKTHETARLMRDHL